MQAAIYIRWSTEEQGDGTTLNIQMDACQAFLDAQGWPLDPARIFIDEGVSGATLQRPALTRLRAAVQRGQVDCVVVYKLDRLSRSVVDVVKLVLDEWEGRCCVKSAREPIDTQTQAGKLFFYQLMSFAEWERSAIRERTFAGKLRRAQEGRNPGIPAAYGFRLGPAGLPEICAPEAQVVGLIFRLYLAGLGSTRIARRLDALGHPSPAGRRWSSGQVARMLANPIYAGTLVYGKQVTARGRKVRSDKPHVVRTGVVPAIIDPETFSAVQKLRGERPAPRRLPALSGGSGRSFSSRSLLTGLLRCRCGHAHCGNGGTGARGRYRYYYCSGACGAGRIRQGELDEVVTAALLDRLGDRSLLGRVALAWERERADARSAVAACEQELARLEGSADRLRQWLLDGRIAPEEYRDLQAGLAARRTACERRRAEAAAHLEGAPPASGLRRWEALEHGQRKQVLAQFVARVTAWRDRQSGALELEISWRLPKGGGAP